ASSRCSGSCPGCSRGGSPPSAARRSSWSWPRAPRPGFGRATACGSLRSKREHATTARAARARLPRRDRAGRRRSHRRRRPLPGRRDGALARGALARRAAPARLRGALRAARRRHDPRTAHQDERWGMSYSDRIKGVIEGSDVAIFMCGNSDRALQALRRAGAPVTAVDVLPDPRIRQELSAISGWPTIPQVFVKGELVGGADIVEELEQLGDGYAAARDEQTVSLV